MLSELYRGEILDSQLDTVTKGFFYGIITKNRLLPVNLPLLLWGTHYLVFAGTMYCADFQLTTYRNRDINLLQKSKYLSFGRHYIRMLPDETKIDIITSDPIDSGVKGYAALNTVECYQVCRENMNLAGMMTLWMPLYESDEENTKISSRRSSRCPPTGSSTVRFPDFERVSYLLRTMVSQMEMTKDRQGNDRISQLK